MGVGIVGGSLWLIIHFLVLILNLGRDLMSLKSWVIEFHSCTSLHLKPVSVFCSLGKSVDMVESWCISILLARWLGVP